MAPSPNRRHKVLLFLTLVALGSSLLLGADTKQVAGVALLGLAATWLVGWLTVRTTVLAISILLVPTGICVCGLPILTDWQTFRTASEGYTQAISDLTDAIRKSPSLPKSREVHGEPWPDEGNVLNVEGPPWKMTLVLRSESFLTDANGKFLTANGKPLGAYVLGDRIVDIPRDVQDLEGPWSEYIGSSTPDFVAAPVSVTVFSRVTDQQILKEIEDELLIPKPTFSAWRSLRGHTGRSLGGFALVVCGLVGFVVGKKKVAFHRPQPPLNQP